MQSAEAQTILGTKLNHVAELISVRIFSYSLSVYTPKDTSHIAHRT